MSNGSSTDINNFAMERYEMCFVTAAFHNLFTAQLGKTGVAWLLRKPFTFCL